MAINAADDFLAVLAKSELLSDEQFARARELAENGNGETRAAPALARALARENLITRWQAGQLLAGRSAFKLGKYKLISKLGGGGMGSVFLGEHVMMNRRVALKVLARKIGEEPGALERFLAEARTIAALDHPNIVHAYSVDNEGDRYYIVMEYVDGVDLQKLVADQGPLDFARASDYIRQAADGLAHAHSQKIVHCDIKPSNLVVNDQDVVKILDMGLARLVGRDEPAADDDESILGSVDYLAPEQAVGGDDFDHRADIYALGCTLYYLLTGRPPFPEGTLPERIVKHQTQEPESIAELRPDTPAGLVAVCSRMMAKKPEDRYQTAEEVSQALVRCRPEGRKPKRAAPLKRAEEIKDDDDLAASPAAAEPRRKAAPPVRKANGAKKNGDEAATAADKATPAAVGLLATPQRKLIAAGIGAGVLLLAGVAVALPFVLGGSKDKLPPTPIASAATPEKQDVPAVQPKKPAAVEDLDDFDKPKRPATSNGGKPEEQPTEPAKESPQTEPPKEQPKTEPPKEQPKTEPPKTEPPKEQPKTEPPKTEPPKEQPKPTPPKEQPKPTPPKPAPKPDPFRDVKVVDLPKLPREAEETGPVGDPVAFGQLHLEAGKPLTVRLVGSREIGHGKTVKQFDLAAGSGQPGSAWSLYFGPKDAPPDSADRVEVAKVWLDGEELKFQWQGGAAKVKTTVLHGCALELASAGKTHLLPLARPQHVDPLPLDFDRGVSRVMFTVDQIADPSTLRVEVTGLEGPFPKTEPDATKVSIAPRGPGRSEKNTNAVNVALVEKDTPTVLLTFGLAVSPGNKKGTLEVAASYKFSDNESLMPFESGQLKQAAGRIEQGVQQAEMMLKNPKLDGKQKPAIQQQIKTAKDDLAKFGGLSRIYQMLNKTGKIQYRIVSLADNQKIELFTTQPLEGSPEAAAPTSTVTAEDLNLHGDDGPKNFFSDDKKQPPKKK